MLSQAKKEFIIILLLILLTAPAVKSLFQPGGYTSHDLTHHVIRQVDMDRLINEGQFPPRWSGDLNKGFGYPLFLFNYPLPALVGEIFVKLDFGYVASVKAVMFLSTVISVLGMYLFLRSLFNSRSSAFLGAIFYVYAPIRFIILYVSAAVGTALALAFLPFIFWAVLEIKRHPKLSILVGSISLAGLILSHNVTALMFAPVILGFVVINFWLQKQINWKRIILMFLLGVGMAAFFWIPASYEKQYIRWDTIFNGYYGDHFPSLSQLVRSPWGYGLDNPEGQADGMSFQIGLIHILVVFILAISLWFYRKNKEFRLIGGFSLVVFLISVFLMINASLLIWENLPFLEYVQYPWRLLSVAIFVASISAALLVKYLPFKKIVFVFLLFLVLYANRNHLQINQVFNPGEEYYTLARPTTASFDEHLPIWAKVPEEDSLTKLEFLTGDAKLEYLENKSNIVRANIESTNSSELVFNQYYFPGWEFKLDNQNLQYIYQNGYQGLPIFEIPDGNHQFIAEFKNTFVRNLADSVSIVSVLLWLILLVRFPASRRP